MRSCEDKVRNAERDKEGIKDQSLRNEHPHLGRKGLGEKGDLHREARAESGWAGTDQEKGDLKSPR